LYDTVLNVTWLRNANANGRMNWTQANTWAANLVVGAYDDWRLPTMIASPNATVSYAGGTDYGYNVRTTSGGTVYSEMASLWYDTLGNKAYCPPGNAECSGAGTPQPGWGLTNTGPFQNLQSYLYWSGLGYAPDTDGAWYFGTGGGDAGSTPSAFGGGGTLPRYAELHDESVPVLHFMRALNKLLVAAGVRVPCRAQEMRRHAHELLRASLHGELAGFLRPGDQRRGRLEG
jgi:hypothetical protein